MVEGVGWKKNFPESQQDEKKDNFIEIRDTSSTAGQLPDGQGELTLSA